MARRGLPLGSKVTLAVVGLPAAIILLPSCVLLAVTMAPSILARLMDRRGNRQVALSLALLNGTASLPALLELWSRGHDYAAVALVLGDPVLWLGPYLAAGVALVVNAMMPQFIANYYQTASAARVRTLMAQQAQLIETWGEEVAEMPEPPEAAPAATPEDWDEAAESDAA